MTNETELSRPAAARSRHVAPRGTAAPPSPEPEYTRFEHLVLAVCRPRVIVGGLAVLCTGAVAVACLQGPARPAAAPAPVRGPGWEATVTAGQAQVQARADADRQAAAQRETEAQAAPPRRPRPAPRQSSCWAPPGRRRRRRPGHRPGAEPPSGGRSPDYAEARTFVTEVEAQKQAAEAAAAQAAAQTAHARAERDRDRFTAQTDVWVANLRAGSSTHRLQTKETFIPSVQLAPGDDDELIVTVGVWFTRQDADAQLRDARWLWETWATTHSPGDPERARIRLIDVHDLPLGGSGPRSAGGSNLKIDPSWPPVLLAGPGAGKPYALGNWKYTVLQTLRLPRLYVRNTFDPTRYTYDLPKGEYVVVGLELENIGRENFGLNSWDFELYDANGIKYTSTSVTLTGWPRAVRLRRRRGQRHQQDAAGRPRQVRHRLRRGARRRGPAAASGAGQDQRPAHVASPRRPPPPTAPATTPGRPRLMPLPAPHPLITLLGAAVAGGAIVATVLTLAPQKAAVYQSLTPASTPVPVTHTPTPRPVAPLLPSILAPLPPSPDIADQERRADDRRRADDQARRERNRQEELRAQEQERENVRQIERDEDIARQKRQHQETIDAIRGCGGVGSSAPRYC